MTKAEIRGASVGPDGPGGKLPGARRLERSVLSQQVSKEVMKGLLEGRLLPGDRLVENDLAQLLGVSRSPIREALAELVQSGMLVRELGRGSRVRQWTKQDLEDLFGVRSVLEGYAARLAHGRIDAKSKKVFEKIIARMRTAGARNDFAAMIELDLDFHQLLWRLAENSLLQQVLGGLSQQFRLFLTMNWKFHGGLSMVAERHVFLLKTLLHDTPAAAEKAMHHHVVVGEMVAVPREPSRIPEIGERADKAGRTVNSEDHGVHR
jgi:DNA-binding GntR family transcriptional regulator